MMPTVKTSERILQMMSIFEVTIPEIAERTGLARSTIWKYANDRQAPRQDKIYIIASRFGINPTWLLGYDVPMKLEDSIEENYHEEIPGTSELILEISRVLSGFDRSQLERVLAYSYGVRDMR